MEHAGYCFTRCSCGALTVEIDSKDYSMSIKDFKRLFPTSKIPKKTTCYCDYCVNHWGIDLCGCGSGEKFGKCKEKFQECSRPAQNIEEGVEKCSCSGAWM